MNKCIDAFLVVLLGVHLDLAGASSARAELRRTRIRPHMTGGPEKVAKRASELHRGHIDGSKFRKIVVIPDVHGDSIALIEALFTGLSGGEEEPLGMTLRQFWDTFMDAVDSRFRYGRAAQFQVIQNDPTVALVQLGDLMDRGPMSLECLEIMNLVHDMLGWRVVSLFGNHEIMNMAGTADGLIAEDDTGGFETVEDRIGAVQPGGVLYSTMTDSFIAMARLAGSDAASSTPFVHGGVDIEWLRRRIFSNTGYCAETLGGLKLVGCVNAEFSRLVSTKEGLDELEDEQLRKDLVAEKLQGREAESLTHAEMERLQSYIDYTMAIYYGNSPVWSRRLAEETRDEGFIACGEKLNQLLEMFEVARIVVGHTPQYDRVPKHRCGGKIILTDIAMSKWMMLDGAPRKPAAYIMDTQSPPTDPLLPFKPYTYNDGTIQEMAFQAASY